MERLERILREEMTAAAEGRDGAAEQRVLSRVRRRQRRRKAPIAAIAAGVVAVGVAVVALNASGVLGGAGERHDDVNTTALKQPPPGRDSVIGPPSKPLGEPCPGSTPTSDALSLDTVQHPVWVPAGARGVTTAFLCDSTPVVVFGDVEVSYESYELPAEDIATYFEQWATAAGHGARVETVLGRPAIVRPASDGYYNMVMVVVDETMVRLLADGDVPIRELVALADSFEAPAP